ncbi:MAG: GMC family oxidoreductase N-terminal domain-containing protein, partial [Pyrinomonadaceae bacterium]|nr:GMC family oxidoreductase N-terminal domain-containing protein [Pyrinomonadaceae bacterium]
AKLLGDPRYNWMYRTEPEAALGGRVLDAPCGRTLGGTGAINGMIHIRGNAADYDGWRDAGNTGWDYKEVLPWFRRSEANVRGASEYHGADGPLAVSDPQPDALSNAFVEAAVQEGWPRNEDFNGVTQDGAGFYQLNTRGGTRASSASAYLKPARGRASLTVQTDALVHRILFDGDLAIGIEYAHGGRVLRARATQIVLSAGAFNSPQLLLRSGIGSASQLRAHDIPVVADSPGVGNNLHNHYRASVIVRCRPGLSLNDLTQSFGARVRMALAYIFARRGPLATGTTAGGFFRSDAALDRPDVQVTFWHYSVSKRDAQGLELHDFPAYTANAVILRPRSRGSLRLASRDPAAAPLIRYNHLDHPEDRRTIAAGLTLVRRIVAMPSLAKLSDGEFAPGAVVSNEKDLIDYARERGNSVYHPVGTCRMGVDEHAVVDPQLRVRGVRGLRVADASIMPTIIAGNTNAPTLMIAERAAAWMLTER